MPSLSVCMMVQNVEKTLPIALESLNHIYDDLIIVDGGSNDRTCEIALSYGATLIHSPWSGNHSQQRNIYLKSVKTDWVFVLDGDEFIDTQTIDFLRSFKASNDRLESDNFWIPRKWISDSNKHHYISSTPHFPDFQRRLFKYNTNIVYTGQIHESIQNLAHLGFYLNDLSIYHLDLFINDEETRRNKVRKYSKSDSRNGGRHYYLPDSAKIQTTEWDYNTISSSIRKLIDDMTPDNKLSNSELNNLIPPEIKHDEFYKIIQKLARTEDIKTVLEIGSSSGGGSTEAFVTGLRDNPNQPQLFCMEVSKPRFAELSKRYEYDKFVKCYNVSSVAIEEFPDPSEVIDFYHNSKNNLKKFPLEMVLGWLQQDIEYVQNAGVSANGIKQVKQDNHIEHFDLVLIDGSEFTGVSELKEVYGSKLILLDDTTTFKNYQNRQQLLADPNYILISENAYTRNGYSIFKKVEGVENNSSQIKAPELKKLISYQDIKAAVELVKGFMVPGQEEYLFNKVQSLPKDAIIVEIGSFQGRSTVAMASACIGTDRHIYSIDTWDGNDSDFSERQFFEIWQQNVENNNLSQYVTPLRGYSHDVLNRWMELAEGKAIDFIFIDGSHQYEDVLKDFEMSFPLVKDGGWIAFHDVINTWPGPDRVWNNIAKLRLVNHQYSSSLACGQKNLMAISTDIQSDLPIHFFTIVLNGQPYIPYHIEIFKQLTCKWHWHIVEGVADLKHDTGWSVQLGGSISDEIHRKGLSHDGTSEYLNELVQLYPDNITIYRKPAGVFWDGKREMVNEPLFNINEECLLWQIDADELWTLDQISTARQMFINHPEKTAAFYWCWYFVGENKIISTRNCYAQNPRQEWLRTWRYKPGSVWVAHEPPRLEEPLPTGQWRDIASVNPFLHQETENHGLVFQHFAYATAEQLRFKEQYYGYKKAVSQWTKLQEVTKFPVLLRDYFAWVGDGTQVNLAESQGVIPIAQKDQTNQKWRFLPPDEIATKSRQINQLTQRIIIDGVFFQFYHTGIARVWKSLLEEWSKTPFIKNIVVLDRANTAPRIPGVSYYQIPAYNYAQTDADQLMLQQVCNELDADLFISTYYTTPLETPSVFMGYDMIPEVLGFDLNQQMWQEKRRAIEHASAYLAISEHTAQDLIEIYPEIDASTVTVAHCGVQSVFKPASATNLAEFRAKYGITKPYFVIGSPGGYKNTELFLQAFAQLPAKSGFDIIVTGGHVMSEEHRQYTFGSNVHYLRMDDFELSLAYSGAIALVYPSKYEGFGLPIVEAFACACPVITCPNASIPEVAGEAAIYVFDDDIDGMAEALCEVQKPQVRAALIAAGLEQVKQFSWTKMGNIISSVLIEQTLSHLPLGDHNLIIFPDWSQDEEELGEEIANICHNLVQSSDFNRPTLLIDTSNVEDLEAANMLISSIAMNLMMSADLDITEHLEIALTGKLAPMQWQSLLPKLQARIKLELEDISAVESSGSNLISEITLTETPVLALV
jgi:glycosyltransferase involved in cell wall biosynthesis